MRSWEIVPETRWTYRVFLMVGTWQGCPTAFLMYCEGMHTVLVTDRFELRWPFWRTYYTPVPTPAEGYTP